MITISFQTAFIAILQIFLMGVVGYFIVYRKFIDEAGLKMLSWLGINVLFPFFIFKQIINHFDPRSQPHWWAYPLINISVVVGGFLIAGAMVLLLGKKESREWVAVSSFHNAGFIPVLLVTMLPLGEKTAELNSYVILTIIGFDLCLWSLGVWLIAYHKKTKITVSNFLTPPLISMFLAFIFVLLGFKTSLPDLLMKPMKVIGDSALPLAMITIGGNMALANFGKIHWKSIGGAVVIKLLVLPILALLFLRVFHVQSVWGLILIIQASMPTSVSLSVLGRYYDNPNQNLINQAIFVTHLLSILTIPLFLGAYGQ